MDQVSGLKLIMISAMFENGGNAMHRLFDGHPGLHVYPFESQLGNACCNDYLSSLLPFRYRYPDFPVSMDLDEIYELFFDEELKTYLRNRKVSKFRSVELKMNEAVRKQRFLELAIAAPRTRAHIVAAFFEATFDAWENEGSTSGEAGTVGYSPLIGFDGEQLLTDFPHGHVVHVVRNPWSAYADTATRPFPWPIFRYATCWSFAQHYALLLAGRYPERFHIVRFEDLVAEPRKTMTRIADRLCIDYCETLVQPSWNGGPMAQITPWGTVKDLSEDTNLARMNALTERQRAEIESFCAPMLSLLDYQGLGTSGVGQGHRP